MDFQPKYVLCCERCGCVVAMVYYAFMKVGVIYQFPSSSLVPIKKLFSPWGVVEKFQFRCDIFIEDLQNGYFAEGAANPRVGGRAEYSRCAACHHYSLILLLLFPRSYYKLCNIYRIRHYDFFMTSCRSEDGNGYYSFQL